MRRMVLYALAHQRPDNPDPAIVAAIVIGAIVGIPLFFYLIGGFFVVQPRTQVVVLRWGRLVRTITEDGIAYVFPLGRRLHRVTSSVISIDLPKMMVVEASGSPIEVSGICSYRVADASRAVLGFADFNTHVAMLATACMKNVCSQYPYESQDPNKPCLRKETDQISRHLIEELQELVNPAGIEVLQMRINDLTYAPEIAQSMLMRQQAVAMVAARRTIVEGAVQTVTGALARMHDTGLADDPATAESLASNLMLVLCSGERVQTFMPITIEGEARNG
jgi:regulator of protease activity HflC (stomatin/prohibitin superfamily)